MITVTTKLKDKNIKNKPLIKNNNIIRINKTTIYQMKPQEIKRLSNFQPTINNIGNIIPNKTNLKFEGKLKNNIINKNEKFTPNNFLND